MTNFIFLVSKITVDKEFTHEIIRHLLLRRKKKNENPRQCIKKQRHQFADKLLFSQRYGFSNSHVGMWELYHKEGWVSKNWCFWSVALEKTLESPWTAKRSNLYILKEIKSEYLLVGLMLKLKLQYFGHLNRRADSLEKDWDAGKDWRQEEKEMAEDEMVR